MILLKTLYIINILIIMGLMMQVMSIVNDMKYGLYWSIVRLIRFKDTRGISWIKKNPNFILYMIFTLVLFFLCMTLIGQLMENRILNRPIFILLLSPLAWLCVFAYVRETSKKIKALEDIK